MSQLRNTRFSDVCGTIDEFKRLLSEEPETAPEILVEFVQDALYMLERMEARLRDHQQFRDVLTQLSEQIQEIGDARRPDAVHTGETMTAKLREGRVLSSEEITGLLDQAEEVRSVANEMEQTLRHFKEIAIQLAERYRGLRGDRSWDRESIEAAEAGLEEQLAAWLPPSPHRERVLEYLRAGRAHVLSEEEDGSPLVQFEDGGVIPLRAVRYSEAVDNFVPASFVASGRARQYRR